jgi:hypothetical protein
MKLAPHGDISVAMTTFISALFRASKIQKQPKYMSVANVFKGVLLSLKKRKSLAICRNMDGI